MKKAARHILKLACLEVALLYLMSASSADPWQYFHAEAVTKYGCQIAPVEKHLNGTGRGQEVWEATANAERQKMPSWSMTIAEYEFTDKKGRHKAMLACDKWMTEAEKRILQVQKPKESTP